MIRHMFLFLCEKIIELGGTEERSSPWLAFHAEAGTIVPIDLYVGPYWKLDCTE